VTPKILGDRVIRTQSTTARRSSRNFNRSFDRRIGQAGVPAITMHGAWKTCGSLLAALEQSLRRRSAQPSTVFVIPAAGDGMVRRVVVRLHLGRDDPLVAVYRMRYGYF
jgi:hypothetical protein